MATPKQVVEITERALGLPPGAASQVVDALRAAGHLPAPGRPVECPPGDAALILLAAAIGNPQRHVVGLASAYAGLKADGYGKTLRDRLAGYLAGDPGIVELRLDLTAPAAVLVYASHGFAVAERYRDDSWPRPAFERHAVLPGDLITKIAKQIAAAPPVKKGRRAAVDKWKDTYDHT